MQSQGDSCASTRIGTVRRIFYGTFVLLILSSYFISSVQQVQEEGDIFVTFEDVFHQVFTLGPSVGMAVNYLDDVRTPTHIQSHLSWIPTFLLLYLYILTKLIYQSSH